MEILMDACSLIAVVVNEPERDLVIKITKNAVLLSPNMISFEVANALTKIMKRKKIDKEYMISLYTYFEKIPLKSIEVNIKRALEIAGDYNIYAYDSFYLEVANRLNIPLLTFDTKMINTAEELGITINGGKNVNI